MTHLTATATLDDVDGQTVRANYAWHVIDFATGSDTLVQNGLDNTLSGVTHFTSRRRGVCGGDAERWH